MKSQNLTLGIRSTFLSSLGFLSVPTMLGVAIAGPSTVHRKMQLNIDPDLAKMLGYDISSFEAAPVNSAIADHSDLKAKYAGIILADIGCLEGYLDFAQSSEDVNSDVHDVGTIAFALTKSAALTLDLISPDKAADYDDDNIFIVAQGAGGEAFVELFEADASMPKNIIASFFANESIFDDTMPQADASTDFGNRQSAVA